MKKHQEDTGNFALKAVFTKDARTAWRAIISATLRERGKKILLPAYIGQTDREGSGVFDAVESTNSDYLFYRLNADLSPDMSDIRKKIGKNIGMLLVIHYFGFCRTDLQQLKRLCDSNGAVLVEDCAHAFYLSAPESMIGQTGHFSFYSIHKYLPTNGGGLLRGNDSDSGLPAIHDSELATSSVIQQFALSNFAEIAAARRKNFEHYSSRLRGVPGLKLMHELRDHDIPQSFPVLVENGLRERLYFHLMERQLPTTALYYRLIRQISEAEYPASYDISRSILNLPVHQDVTAADATAVCSEIVAFLGARR